ncbi:MAG: DUF4837 family protein [Gemmatimonadota bacterium]
MSLSPRPSPKRRAAASALAIASVLALSCGRPAAMGEANSLIVVAPDSLWTEVREATYATLEPTIFTTREDKKFVVTQVDPASAEVSHLLLWRQVIVFGTPGDPLLERITDRAKGEAGSGILQAADVWARGQLATAVVLEPGREAESWRERLPELERLIDAGYRTYVRSRMFVSGVDSALAGTLAERLGVTLRVPKVYRTVFRDPDIALIRNDNPDPSELIRSILLQVVPGADSLTPEALYAWRESVDGEQYNVPQRIGRNGPPPRRFSLDGREALEVAGTWADESDFPAAGPFFVRAVRCGERTVFADAWLYSPSPRRSKYEYLIQLEEILDSLRCTSGT